MKKYRPYIRKVEGRLLGSVLFTCRGCSVKNGALSQITLMFEYTGDRHVDIYIWSASSSVFSLISKVWQEEDSTL